MQNTRAGEDTAGRCVAQGMGGGGSSSSSRTWLGSRNHPEDKFPARGLHPAQPCPTVAWAPGLVRASPAHTLSLAHAQPRASQGAPGPGK